MGIRSDYSFRSATFAQETNRHLLGLNKYPPHKTSTEVRMVSATSKCGQCENGGEIDGAFARPLPISSAQNLLDVSCEERITKAQVRFAQWILTSMNKQKYFMQNLFLFTNDVTTL